jgi:HD-GYP domain-containing protein (c-di-GMP phosphodiesterase class II)
MAMKKLKIGELKPGMVFDKAVYIDMNNMLVAPMVPLKEEDINRLKKWGINEVETAGQVVAQGRPVKQKRVSIKDEVSKLTQMLQKSDGVVTKQPVMRTFHHIYRDVCKLVEDIFEKVRNGVGYDKDRILSAVDELIIEVSKDSNNAIHEITREQESKYIYSLSVNVAILSTVTGLSLGYGNNRLIPLVTGALLHDIGMVRVPNYITEKNGALTPDEYNRIKTHPIYGYRIIIKELDLGNDVASVALQHHEAYDGSGYPRKLKGDEISEYARIVSICDVFIAMTKKRSYRDEHLSYSAMKNIIAGTNRKFDPHIVKAFLGTMAIYPVGSIVELNNGMVARVVSANAIYPLRPKITVVFDEYGEKIDYEKVIDLQESSDLFITKPLSKSYIRQLFNE